MSDDLICGLQGHDLESIGYQRPFSIKVVCKRCRRTKIQEYSKSWPEKDTAALLMKMLKYTFDDKLFPVDRDFRVWEEVGMTVINGTTSSHVKRINV